MRAIRTFFRHIRNGFRNLFRNGWMTVATLLTMTITLIMIGGIVLLMSNVENITTDIEEGVKIRTHIDIAASPEEEAELQESIEQLEHVTQVTYRSKEEEYEDLVATMGEEFELFEGDANPFFNVLIVDVDDTSNLQEVTDHIAEMPYAAEVTYGEIETENLLRAIDITRYIMAFVSAVLVVIAVLLISNTIKLTIYARSNEIEIMRLVGAKNSYIRAPFIYEGTFIGIISSLIATALLYAIYEGIQSATVEIFGLRLITFTPSYPILLYIGIGLLVVGILLGIIGAIRSTRQALTI